jgi:hypothetical protein
MSKNSKSNMLSSIEQLLKIANLSKLEAVLELLTTNNLNLSKSKSTPSNTVVNEKSGRKFKIAKVVGDGTCFYHSIVQAGKNKDIDGLAELEDGNALRLFLITQLETLRSGADQLFVDPVNSNSAIANSLNIEKKQVIINIFQGIQEEQGNFSNIKNRGNKITQGRLKQMIGVIIRNLKEQKWGGGPILQLLTIILPICVKYYNTVTRTFDLVKSNATECTEENTIYIYYNGSSHYDALEEIK